MTTTVPPGEKPASTGKFGDRRKFLIVAQDPSVRHADGQVVTAEITLPWEDLIDGPMGYAAYVIDYDATAEVMYRPAELPADPTAAAAPVGDLLDDPNFHALNVFAIVMRTLLRFEFALGRRIAWGIRGHQIKVVPHAFEEANAYYSPELEAIALGYVRGPEPLFLCLSHDVLAHETAHALLDGLRDRFMAPSSADQAALHEAFADIVALLSVYSLPELVSHLLAPSANAQSDEGRTVPDGFVPRSALSSENLERTALFGLAEQMRSNVADTRVNALRRSITITPAEDLLRSAEYQEEHRRGEVFVAAVMRGFLTAWVARIEQLAVGNDGLVSIAMAAEQGAEIADTLLTMAIRAVDYTPPIHISFGDFLSAMLTADAEVRADDSRFALRIHLTAAMAAYGITPASDSPGGLWLPTKDPLQRSGAHLGALQSDPTEMFRHIWNNRNALRLNPEAYTRVASVRPCLRISPTDGAQIRETVVECTQYLKLSAAELPTYHLHSPPGMRPDQDVVLEGGSTLILDEYGDLKFEISNRVISRDASKADIAKWQHRLDYMWERGYLDGVDRSSRLAAFHLERNLTARGHHEPEDERRLRRLTDEVWI
jgi:hypothetical protein